MLISIGLEAFTPMQVGTIRIVVAAVCLMPFGLKHLNSLPKADILVLAVSGFLGSLLPALLFSFAQSKIDSSVSAILGGLTPVFTMLIGTVIFKQAVKSIHVVGVALCFVGASSLVLKDFSIQTFQWMPALCICGATMCYAINVNLIKYRMKHVKPLALSSVSMFVVGPLAAIVLFQTPVLELDFTDAGVLKSAFALLFLGITSTALGLLLFNNLLKVASPLFASSITYLIPIVALSLGYLYGETITLNHFLSLILILSGIYLITRK